MVFVEVINAAGATSTEAITLTYPATFAVSWVSTPSMTALPGGALMPTPTLRVYSRDAATCSLTINVSSCATSDPTLASRPAGMTVATQGAALAVGSSGSVYANTTELRLNESTVSGASGCAGTLTASCVDATGQTASTVGQVNPSIALPAWRADWNTAAMPHPFTVVPGALLVLSAMFTLLGGGDGNMATVLAASLSCQALVLLASTLSPVLDKSLDLVSTRDVVSSSTAAVAAMTASSAAASVVFAGLSASAVPLGQALSVYAECTWKSTGERVRLPTVALSTAELVLEWVAPPTTVLGYMPLTLHLVLTTLMRATVAGTAAIAATAECEVSLVNATVRGTQVVADTWALTIDGAAPAGTVVTTAVNVTLQAAQAAIAFVRVACNAWGQTLASPPLRLAVASLDIRCTSALPTYFIASDASSPWPVEPQLEVVVAVIDASDASTTNATDVTCSLSTTTAGVELKVAGNSASSALLSIPAHQANGSITVPRFYVQTATTTPAVELVIECRRTSGDAPPPLYLTIAALRLTAQLCTQPAQNSFVGTALPTFNVSIVSTPPDGPSTTPCTNSMSPAFALPAIVCSMSLEAATTSISDTSNTFLKHTVATMAAASHLVTFDAFTLVAQQGETYGLSLACAVGGLAISPTLAFTVTLAGCSIGQESVGVQCLTCEGTTFSLGGIGARCINCPPAGATCVSGILTLLPYYYRPPAQAGAPLGPGTELHPCYNAEACTLTYNGSTTDTVQYGCSYGYTGPLCGVCDADVNYAQFGGECSVCWDASASWLFFVALVTIALVVLTRVALRKDSGRTDATILLRIMLGFLQAVGSLRVFRAGSTKAYDSVMGWTEVVSASPLSAGALQCILRLPYLVQYITTILLPALVSAAVVAIFIAVTTARSLHRKPRCRMDTAAFKSAMTTWWASKRHLSTALFVLFLAYMPIVSASLRALDCIVPVAGIRYLRSDLRVECGVRDHAAARALAYTVLVALGVGFPAGLAWLLGTAQHDQLADTGFHATWGFLFDGYRAPTRTLAAQPTLIAGSGASDGKGTSTSNKLPAIGKLTAAPPGGVASGHRGRRRSSVLPDRMVQSWVVAGDSRVWWEALVLCRKAGVVLLAVLVTNPYLQCVGATLWFLGALLLQLRYTPYTKSLFNRVETVSLASTLLTAIISTALLQFNVGVSSAEQHAPESMDGIEWAVTVLLAVLNVGTFALLAGVWLRAQCTRARGIISRTALVTVLSGRVAGMRTSLTGSRRRSTGTGVGAAARKLGMSPASDGSDTIEAAGGVTLNPLRARGAGCSMPKRVAFPAVVSGTGSADVSGDAAATHTLPAAPSTAVSRLHLGDSGDASELPQLGSIIEAPNEEAVVTAARAGDGHGLADGVGSDGGSSGAGERHVAFAATPTSRTRRK